MRFSLGSLMVDLPPMASARLTALEVVAVLFISLFIETLRQREDHYVTLNTLWHLYTLLGVRRPARHKRLFLDLLKDLPQDIQKDIARQVRGLTDAGSVLLAELLAEQIRPEERLRVARHPYLPGGRTERLG